MNSSKDVIVRSKAPLRISFGGGGTDVSPYPEECGGITLSATIDKYIYTTLVVRDDECISAKSLDYDTSVKYNTNGEFKYDGNLDLVKAATKVMGVTRGCDLFLHSDAPPGTGLGSSSTLVVSMISSLSQLHNTRLSTHETAELAYHIEREELSIKGGRQDQYAAAFGGFNFMEFNNGTTIVNPLHINEGILNELEYRLMLCYTGKRRLSAGIIDDQVESYKAGKEEVLRALHETKTLAVDMRQALLRGQLNKFGELLHSAWCSKKQFSDKMSDSHIDTLYDTARRYGAIGGKLLGAGGGGYLLLLCEFDKKHIVADRLAQLGGQIVGFSFDIRGVQTWEVNGN